MDEQLIESACERHGAGAVANAASRRMKGDRAALPGIGLPDAICLGEAYRIAQAANRWMSEPSRTDASRREAGDARRTAPRT